MEETAHSGDMDPFRSLLIKMIDEKLGRGICGNKILILLQEIMEFVQTVIDPLEQSGQAPMVSCGCGCSFCCHSQVNIIPVEALLIFSFITARFNVIEMEDLKKKINNNDLLTRGKTLKERVKIKEKTPCVFLKANICAIYPVRPFICRSWNSLDQTTCQSAFISGNHQAQIESSPVRNYVFSTARDVFQDFTSRMRLESGFLDIPHAILSCLNSPDVIAHWLADDPVLFNVESDNAHGMEPVPL